MPPEPSIHVHEDDCGMRVLVPASALADVQRDQERAGVHHSKHTDPKGLTTQPYMIQPPSMSFADMPLRLADAAAALEPHFPRVRKFSATAGAGFDDGKLDAYGSYETDAYCYGTGAECFIKLEHKDGIVNQVWFECLTSDMAELARFRAALVAIDCVAPSAIADYWLNMSGEVRDQDFMDRYCQAILRNPD